MVFKPLGGWTEPGLSGYPRHVRQAGPPPVLIRDLSGLTSFSCSPGMLVGPLVAWDPLMRRNPSDGNLIGSCQDSGTNLDGCGGEALTRTDVLGPGSIDG